ncbi:MAG: YIEGIA family protein [Dethiobacteria bacterium]
MNHQRGGRSKLPGFVQAMTTGIIIGSLIRYDMLKRDYRLYPSYPHGVVIHLALGFIAAVIGAVAIPALLEKEFTAVTFLALAATQFREVRGMERDMLEGLDRTNLVPRGPDYIEGIARVFEARNYLVMLAALLISGATFIGNIYYGLLMGVATFIISKTLMKGKNIGDIALVRAGRVHFEGAKLFVDNIQFMNLALQQSRETYLKRGLGIIVEPLNDNGRATLANNGQRKAIAHDAAALLGVYKDVDSAEFTPLVRRSLDTGRVGLVIVPMEKDISVLIEAVKRVPVLESALSTPLKTTLGKKAAD